METQQSYIDVTYIPGVTVYGSGPARLTWEDDKIALTKVEGTKEAPVYTEVFTAGLGQIEKVVVVLDQIRFYVNGKRYNMSVAQYATPAVAVGGVAGIVVGASMYQKSGAPKLLEWLTAKGVRVKRFGYGALTGVAVGAAVVVMGIIFLAAFLASQ